MINVVFLLSAIVIYAPAVYSQHDTVTNDTIIGITTHSLIEGSIRFSLELLRTLIANSRGNSDSQGIFFSPYSIWSALVTIYLGARGTTEQDMRNVLGIGDTDKLLTWEAFRNINSLKKTIVKGTSFISTNRIFFQHGTTIKSCVRDMLDNDVTFIDFRSDADETRKIINTWVQTQTQQRIKDLIPRGGIDALTNMVVANAVYFKDAWPFKSREGTNCKMSARGRFLYSASEELQCYAVELPYNGNSFSITILFPYNYYNGFDILSINLTLEKLKNLPADMCPRDVDLCIPKFKLEDRFELSQPLSKMGLRSLFDPTRVNLSGFTGNTEVTVDGVYHKAFIDARDESTEDTPVTTVISSKCAKLGLADVNLFGSHSFIYFIRDRQSNVIFFVGVVQKPPGNGTSGPSPFQWRIKLIGDS